MTCWTPAPPGPYVQLSQINPPQCQETKVLYLLWSMQMNRSSAGNTSLEWVLNSKHSISSWNLTEQARQGQSRKLCLYMPSDYVPCSWKFGGHLSDSSISWPFCKTIHPQSYKTKPSEHWRGVAWRDKSVCVLRWSFSKTCPFLLLFSAPRDKPTSPLSGKLKMCGFLSCRALNECRTKSSCPTSISPPGASVLWFSFLFYLRIAPLDGSDVQWRKCYCWDPLVLLTGNTRRYEVNWGRDVGQAWTSFLSVHMDTCWSQNQLSLHLCCSDCLSGLQEDQPAGVTGRKSFVFQMLNLWAGAAVQMGWVGALAAGRSQAAE